MKKEIRFIIEGALIAAAYICLTVISNFIHLAYGPIQFRLSEVLCIMPLFTFAAIPGLAIGCFVSNIISSLGPIDMLIGAIATLLAAVLTYWLRKICMFGVPIFSFLSPVILNSVFIGLELNFFYLENGASLWGFLISALSVGLGEFCVCFLLGIPMYFSMKRYHLFSEQNECNIFDK